jgi:hypothetical protein
MVSLSIEFERYYKEFLSFLAIDDPVQRRQTLASRIHIRWMLWCERPITELMQRLNIQDMDILSVGSGEGHEEFWFGKHGNRLTLLDANPDFATRLAPLSECRSETTLDFVVADIQDYLKSPRQFDFCYISSLHPDEMYRRELLRHRGPLFPLATGELVCSNWPINQPPVLPYVAKCATLIKDGGWFVFQSYASSCSVTENPHFLELLCRQLGQEGLQVIEAWYFELDPSCFLVVAKKETTQAENSIACELDNRPLLTTFHGRHPSDRKNYINRLSRSDIAAMAANSCGLKDRISILGNWALSQVSIIKDQLVNGFVRRIMGVSRRLGTRRLGTGSVFQRTSAVPRSIAYRAVGRLRLLGTVLETYRHPTRFPHALMSDVDFTQLKSPKIVVLHTFDSRHVPMVRALAENLGASQVRILAMDSDAAGMLSATGWPCNRIRDVALDLHAEVAAHEKGHDSVCRLLEKLDRHSYRGAPLGDFIRLPMFQRDETFRRVWRGVMQFWGAGSELVIIATTTQGEHTNALMPLAEKLAAMHPAGGGGAMQVEGRKNDLWLWTDKVLEDRSWVSRPPKTPVFIRWLPFPLSAIFDPTRDFLDRRLPRIQAVWAEQELSGRPIVVISDAWPGSVYWNGMLPVINAIQNRDHPVLVITNNAAARDALTINGIATAVILHGSEIPELKQAQALASAIGELDAMTSQSVGTEPVETALIESLRVDLRFLAQLTDGMAFLDCVAEMLHRLDPVSMIVMPIWSPNARWSEAAARRVNLPTISYPTVTVSGDRWSLVDWRTDFVAAYGSQCASAFKQIGFTSDRLILTGNPAMDSLYGIDRATSLYRLAADHGISTDRRILLVATTGADPQEAEWVVAFAEYCNSRGDCQVIVKPHPNFTAEDYGNLPHHDFALVLRFVESADVRDLLAISEICITDMSTVGAEAVVMGIPLLVVNLTGERYVANPYDEEGVALLATSLDEIPGCLDTLLENSNVREDLLNQRKKFTDAYNHGDDGAAADRVAHLAITGGNSA